jgi:hypothetical protein
VLGEPFGIDGRDVLFEVKDAEVGFLQPVYGALSGALKLILREAFVA